MATTTGFFVLILKCTEATPASTAAVPAPAASSTAPAASSTAPAAAVEDINTYEKIHIFKLETDDASFKNLKNIPTTLSPPIIPNAKNDNTNNHAIVFIKLSNGTIMTSSVTNDYYQEIKYFDQDGINKFINKMKIDIDGTGSVTPSKVTEMNCYQSKYEMKDITNDDTYATLKLNSIPASGPSSNNILINNGGKIVVTSSKNDDQLILHYVSKMFGFEDIIGQIDKDLTATSTVSGGASLDDFEEEFTDTQPQNLFQEGGMKRRTKQNTRKKK